MPAVSEAVLLLCERVVREQGTNKVYLMGLFDQLLVSALPGQLACAVYARFVVDPPAPAPCPVQLVLERPAGRLDGPPPGVLAPGAGKFEAWIQAQLPIAETGRHRLILIVDGHTVATASFAVTMVAPAVPPPPDPHAN